MKLAVIYRACGLELDEKSIKQCRPRWFNKRLLWDSFSREFNGYKDIDVHVVYDGETTDLSDYIQPACKVFYPISVKNNEKSLIACYDLASDLFKEGYEAVYFLEDDYLHREGSKEVLIEGLGMFGMVTLYEHLDRYVYPQGDVTYFKEAIFAGKKNYWRSVESTTCTFALTREMFEKVRGKLYNFRLNDRLFFRALITEGVRLFSPMPGFSTHADIRHLSPYVNWNEIAEHYANQN